MKLTAIQKSVSIREYQNDWLKKYHISLSAFLQSAIREAMIERGDAMPTASTWTVEFEETTTIRLRNSTFRKLRAMGSRGQSDDFIVNAILFRLMEKAEGGKSQRVPAASPEASKAAEEGSPSPSAAKP